MCIVAFFCWYGHHLCSYDNLQRESTIFQYIFSWMSTTGKGMSFWFTLGNTFLNCDFGRFVITGVFLWSVLKVVSSYRWRYWHAIFCNPYLTSRYYWFIYNTWWKKKQCNEIKSFSNASGYALRVKCWCQIAQPYCPWTFTKNAC